jgi:hypothetical protein
MDLNFSVRLDYIVHVRHTYENLLGCFSIMRFSHTYYIYARKKIY